MTELDVLTAIANSNNSILYAMNLHLVITIVAIIFTLFVLVFYILGR